MCKLRLLFAASLLAGGMMAVAQQFRYNVGTAATPGNIHAQNIFVMPAGKGLPDGHGTARQGRALFNAKCASCHGARGQGTPDFPALVGGSGTLSSDAPNPTVGSYWPYATTVWDYIHRAMPYQNPGSLTPDQVYSLTAYILCLNKIIDEHEELNRKTLPRVRMPNRHGFVPDARPDVK